MLQLTLYMSFKKMLILVFVIALSFYIGFSSKEDLSFYEVVQTQPRGIANIPTQWFEMKTVFGWEKMSLFFGYGDNASICKHLVNIASKESPEQQFRCTPAN